VQLVTRPEPWVVGEFTGKATHGLGNRRRAFWHVPRNPTERRGEGPAGVEDALVVGDEDVDAVDVAAAGRDALGQLGDDAHGVLAVSIRPRSVEAAAAAPDGAAGTGMRGWGGRKRRGGLDGVRGTGRGGCRGGRRRARPRRAAAAPRTASADEPIDLLYLSFPAARMDGWMGCPSAGGAEQMEMSRRCQPIPISS